MKVRTFSPSPARNLLYLAQLHKARGEPLPVDLLTRLLEAGFDISDFS